MAEVGRILVTGESADALSIAYAAQNAGLDTTLLEDDMSSKERAHFFLQQFAKGSGRTGPLPNIVIRDELVGKFDIVIDAGLEALTTRASRLEALTKWRTNDAIFLVNTTQPDLPALKSMQPIAAIHFIAPAHRMDAIEVTSPHPVIDALAARLNKRVIRVAPNNGLVAERLSVRFYEAADTLLLDGSLPHEIDEAMVRFGFSIGPYEAQDLSGLDGPYYKRKRANDLHKSERRPIPISDRMVEEGRLGKKVGVGWYRYPGGGGAVIDPLLEDLITEEAHFAGIERTEFSDEEIQQRLLLSLINEAAFILSEHGIAAADDIDFLTSRIFAAKDFKVCEIADEMGVKTVWDRLCALSKDDPVAWRPSPLIAELADHGSRLQDVKTDL